MKINKICREDTRCRMLFAWSAGVLAGPAQQKPERKLEKQGTTLALVVCHVLSPACFDWLLLSFARFAAAGGTPALRGD
jgi:hypothetical protein